jgi:hypothetical protein
MIRFLAQIAENRETRLSRPFLGPGDIFSTIYDENQIRSERHGPYEARIHKTIFGLVIMAHPYGRNR